MGRNELALIGEIEKTVSLLEEVRSFYVGIQQNELQQLGKTRATALIVAQVLENYYTCLETLFLRISQYFENSLLKNKWHSDLLDKMILDIEGIRPPVVSSKTYKNLRELMRFRHFKRYYFELMLVASYTYAHCIAYKQYLLDIKRLSLTALGIQ